MADIVERLRDCWLGEPVQSLVEEAADEITRLRAGGCARDQGTTQYCVEAARLADKVGKLEAEAHSLTEETNRLRTAVQATATTLHETDRQSDRLRAEVERLRAALEIFACDCTLAEECAIPSNCRNYLARAALGGEA